MQRIVRLHYDFLIPLFNAIRFGISMYGLSPSPEIKPILPYDLKEAFSLKTKIVHVKQLSRGDSVSYGATYTAQEDEWIATLPIGYADGWIRKLQGQEVIVAGEKAPIVGRICMDQCMIKLSQTTSYWYRSNTYWRKSRIVYFCR